jgi:hypothetical protein
MKSMMKPPQIPWTLHLGNALGWREVLRILLKAVAPQIL